MTWYRNSDESIRMLQLKCSITYYGWCFFERLEQRVSAQPRYLDIAQQKHHSYVYKKKKRKEIRDRQAVQV